jgi:hypothetical protein
MFPPPKGQETLGLPCIFLRASGYLHAGQLEAAHRAA